MHTFFGFTILDVLSLFGNLCATEALLVSSIIGALFISVFPIGLLALTLTAKTEASKWLFAILMLVSIFLNLWVVIPWVVFDYSKFPVC
jgi:hypothetical protein